MIQDNRSSRRLHISRLNLPVYGEDTLRLGIELGSVVQQEANNKCHVDHSTYGLPVHKPSSLHLWIISMTSFDFQRHSAAPISRLPYRIEPSRNSLSTGTGTLRIAKHTRCNNEKLLRSPVVRPHRARVSLNNNKHDLQQIEALQRYNACFSSHLLSRRMREANWSSSMPRGSEPNPNLS